jgi:hypothetical protein
MNEMGLRTRIATGVVAAALALAVTGSAAAAAFEPPARTSAASESGVTDARVVAMFAALLDRLVANGTITAEQKDKILEAVRAAGQRRDGEQALKRILSGLMGLAVQYLGLETADVKEALGSGMSLGQLADATEGKSRAELITALIVETTALVDRALAGGHLTSEEAERAKAGLTERVTAFVDRVHEKDEERTTEKKERAKEKAEKKLEHAKKKFERAKEKAAKQLERARERFERAREKAGSS